MKENESKEEKRKEIFILIFYLDFTLFFFSSRLFCLIQINIKSYFLKNTNL